MKPMDEGHFAILRRHMVELIAIYGELMSEEIGRATFDERVLAAMMRVPRHRFVPAPLVPLAYQDAPLPIGFDKTISQPFICALMADLLAAERTHAVLEIGTGLGYQAAILAELVDRVWSVEVVEELATEAASRLRELGYTNVALRIGDGSRGWAEHAPYDRILVTAAAEAPPAALIGQLRAGGRMVMPIGPPDGQRLTVVDKTANGDVRARPVLPVRFTLLETVI
ncbi:protein-L-isoaspartate(D-aspartate) O-methyltransferase [Elioraea sp.]|uniref:protein-L-isoaspartate(D-aspartate) O-methyltransferase n=1 Tax=Elioraea sp. TaxID=2185103 RepID=UPI0021DEDD46|nr:protein-L-isoaspartate(D-aspartate) O-methyltransferase [Elioraea sp.]GIX10792.1 MAG: protein-L-isoaspartate O-methyltransferase [Elioraea sp.]